MRHSTPVSLASLDLQSLREHVATLEAGHATIGTVLGFQVIEALVNQAEPVEGNPDGLALGHVLFDRPLS